MAFTVPNLQFNQSEGNLYTGAAQMFLAQAKAAAELRLQKRQQEEAERAAAAREKHDAGQLAAYNRQIGASESTQKFNREKWEKEQAAEAQTQLGKDVDTAAGYFDKESKDFNPGRGEAFAAAKNLPIVRDAPGEGDRAMLPLALDTPPAMAIAMGPRRPKPVMQPPMDDPEAEAMGQAPQQGAAAPVPQMDDPEAEAMAEVPAQAQPEVTPEEFQKKAFEKTGPRSRGVGIQVDGKTVWLEDRQEEARSREREKLASDIGRMALTPITPLDPGFFKATSKLAEVGLVDRKSAMDQINKFMSERNLTARAAMAAAARKAAADAEANKPPTPAEGRGAIGSLDSSIQQWQKDTGYDELAKSYRDLGVGLRQLQSGNPIEQTGARFAIGKQIAGQGQFTEGEQKTILGNIGGKFESWMQAVQSFMNGKLTADQEQHFVDAIKLRLKDIRERRAPDLAVNFKDAYLSPGSGYEDMPANVQNRFNRLFKPFGVAGESVGGAGAKATGGRSKAVAKPQESDEDRLRRIEGR
jgi:hypothetical protein